MKHRTTFNTALVAAILMLFAPFVFAQTVLEFDGTKKVVSWTPFRGTSAR